MPLVMAVFSRLLWVQGPLKDSLAASDLAACSVCLLGFWSRSLEQSPSLGAQSHTWYPEGAVQAGLRCWDLVPLAEQLRGLSQGCCEPLELEQPHSSLVVQNIQPSSARAQVITSVCYHICLCSFCVCRAQLKLTRLRCSAQGPEGSSAAPTWPTSPLWLPPWGRQLLLSSSLLLSADPELVLTLDEPRAQLRALKRFWFTSAHTKYTAGEHVPTGTTVQGL